MKGNIVPNDAAVNFQAFSTQSLFIGYIDHEVVASDEFNGSLAIEINGQDILSPKSKIVEVGLEIHFKSKIKEYSSPFIQYVCLATFYVENFDEIFRKDKEEDKYLIPDNFSDYFLNLTYNTARGTLVEKLSTTIYRSYILPVLPDNMLRKSRDFRKKSS